MTMTMTDTDWTRLEQGVAELTAEHQRSIEAVERLAVAAAELRAAVDARNIH